MNLKLKKPMVPMKVSLSLVPSLPLGSGAWGGFFHLLPPHCPGNCFLPKRVKT